MGSGRPSILRGSPKRLAPQDDAHGCRMMAKAPSQNAFAVPVSDKATALALTPVSRETAARLDRYVELLLQWQAKTNLVASSPLPNLWTRHVAGSLPLLSIT